jgi:hypothetical protein
MPILASKKNAVGAAMAAAITCVLLSIYVDYLATRVFVVEAYTLLGPLLLIADISPENRAGGAVTALVLCGLAVAPLVRFNWVTMLLAISSVALWWFIGVVAIGINV